MHSLLLFIALLLGHFSSRADIKNFSLQGKPIDFSGEDESTSRWVQDFNMKTYATPAKLESIDGRKAKVENFMHVLVFSCSVTLC